MKDQVTCDADDPRNPDNNPNDDLIIFWPLVIGSIIATIGFLWSEIAKW